MRTQLLIAVKIVWDEKKLKASKGKISLFEEWNISNNYKIKMNDKSLLAFDCGTCGTFFNISV